MEENLKNVGNGLEKVWKELENMEEKLEKLRRVWRTWGRLRKRWRAVWRTSEEHLGGFRLERRQLQGDVALEP